MVIRNTSMTAQSTRSIHRNPHHCFRHTCGPVFGLYVTTARKLPQPATTLYPHRPHRSSGVCDRQQWRCCLDGELPPLRRDPRKHRRPHQTALSGTYVDPRGEQASGGSTYWQRFSQCVNSRDPLGNYWKAVIYGIGGPVPKAMLPIRKGLGGVRVSRYTTIPSASAHWLTGGRGRQSISGSVARNAGRLANGAFIVYGWYLLGTEAICACEVWE